MKGFRFLESLGLVGCGDGIYSADASPLGSPSALPCRFSAYACPPATTAEPRFLMWPNPTPHVKNKNAPMNRAFCDFWLRGRDLNHVTFRL